MKFWDEMGMTDVLEQDEVWIDGGEVVHELRLMKKEQRNNVMLWLLRHAEGVKFYCELELLAPQNPEEATPLEIIESRMGSMLDQTGQQWMEQTPLMQELTRIAIKEETASGE